MIKKQRNTSYGNVQKISINIYINEPIVGERSSKESEVKLRRRLLLPTPESPIINNLNK